VIIGLGSMIGAGVFAAFAPAAEAAGAGLLIGLAIAAVVAYCNATASAQLAAQYPTSGGTYVYGRERLGDWWGFLAGWGFVIGKTASCAAMALTFAAYASPGDWQRPVAVAIVVALAAVNYRGVTRTARLTRVIVAVVLAALAVVVAAGILGGEADPDRATTLIDPEGGWYGLLQSAGLLFFAFAGYARIATMGEEVRDPQRTIPRAIQIALAITVAVYAIIAVTILSVLGPEGLHEQARHWPPPLTPAPGTGPDPSFGSAEQQLPWVHFWRWWLGSGAPPWPWLARTTYPDGSRQYTRATRSRITPRSRSPPSFASWYSPSTCVARSASPPSGSCSTTSSPTSAPSPRTGTTAASLAHSKFWGRQDAASWSSPCRSHPCLAALPYSRSALAIGCGDTASRRGGDQVWRPTNTHALARRASRCTRP